MRRLIVLTLAAAMIAGSASAYELVESWNVDQPSGGGIYGFPANFAVKYIPAVSYTCAKIEFWGSGSTFFDNDVITVRIETELLDQPSGEVLASVVTLVLDGDNYWMGSDFSVPVALQAGTPYWVIFLPMAWSPVNWADEGDEHLTMSSGDAIHWNPATARRWKARFWGDPVVATDAATWSQVKALFD